MNRSLSFEEDMAEDYEGQDIMYYVNRKINDIKDDNLTVERIRGIYVQIKLGNKYPAELAHYYNIPVKVVADIAAGILFNPLTKDLL